MEQLEKPRLSRLTAILTQLQSKRVVTARHLAEKHGVSIRTIYRDIRSLEKSGVPVTTEEGKGYSLMEGYRLPPVMFSEEEANALVTAERLIRKNRDQSLVDNYANAIEKIKAVLKGNQQEKVDLLADRIEIRVNQENQTTSNHLMSIQSAICHFRLLTIKYHSLQDQLSKREIEPFALYSTHENWILIAFCRLKQDFRAFRLDRIIHLVELEEHFEPHHMTLQDYFDSCAKYWKTSDIPLTQGESSFVSNQKKETMKTTKIEPFKIVGISTRTANANGQAQKDLSELWGRVMAEDIPSKIPNKAGEEIVSVYCNYETDENGLYDVIIGCKVSSTEKIPEGMISASVAGGEFAEFIAKGDLTGEAIIGTWQRIWQSDLDRAFTHDFEMYGEKAMNPKDGEASVFIALNN